MVILRCIIPLWDFSFRSYEDFKIIICLEKIIVTLSRPFLLSIQDISTNEVLFLQKSIKKGIRSRVVESKSLKVGKSLKIGFDFLLDFWQKKYLIIGDVLNAE